MQFASDHFVWYVVEQYKTNWNFNIICVKCNKSYDHQQEKNLDYSFVFALILKKTLFLCYVFRIKKNEQINKFDILFIKWITKLQQIAIWHNIK